MKFLNYIENEFNKLCIVDFLIFIYLYVLVIELSNYLVGKFDEDLYENFYIKVRLYLELLYFDYICFYLMNKCCNEIYNWYMLIMEEC